MEVLSDLKKNRVPHTLATEVLSKKSPLDHLTQVFKGNFECRKPRSALMVFMLTVNDWLGLLILGVE